MAKFFKVLLYLLIPFVCLFLAFQINVLLGWAVFVVGMGIMLWLLRGDLLTMIGNIKFQKDHGKGFLWFERALKTGRMRPDNQLIYAYLLLRDGSIDKAERMINKTLFLSKKKVSADVLRGSTLNLALIKWKRGNLKEAIADMEEMYADGYRSTVHYGTLGYFYILDGQYQKGLEFNREAHEYNEDDDVIYDNLAYNCFLTGDIRTAADMYEEILEHHPTFIEPYYNYALVLEKMGDYESAIDLCKQALTYSEKFLSTVTHEMVENLKTRLESGQLPPLADSAAQPADDIADGTNPDQIGGEQAEDEQV